MVIFGILKINIQISMEVDIQSHKIFNKVRDWLPVFQASTCCGIFDDSVTPQTVSIKSALDQGQSQRLVDRNQP